MAEFSMASMTDVIFLLLIFFMVTSTFVFPIPQPNPYITLFWLRLSLGLLTQAISLGHCPG